MTNEHDTSPELNVAPGVFSLPAESPMVNQQTPNDTVHRPGASHSTWSQDDHNASPTEPSPVDEFPMIVWLRGDEPWYSEFDMDAEATMNALGIKRSRLTQISGKDLRVGRVRVDRYIRPIFRSRDVEEYLNQTRATASHQKSSDALNSAAELLCKQIDRIEARLETLNQNLMTQIESALQKVITETFSSVLSRVAERLDALEGDVVNRLSVLTQETLLKHVDSIQKDLATKCGDLSLRIDSSTKELTESHLLQDKSFRELTSKMEAIDEKFPSLGVEIRNSESSLRQDLKVIMSDLSNLRKPDKILKTKSKDSRLETGAAHNQSPARPARHSPTRRKKLRMR